jgi:ubiquinone/menaquinone biosynthesis C-methylase UbiE
MSTGTLRHTSTAPAVSSNAPSDAGEYVLGTGSDEGVRLGLQHRLWSAAAHQLWERAGLQPGQTVMDLGCGPGHASVDMAQIVGPTGRVIAIDESATFLKQLRDHAESRRLSNIERVLGDVQSLDECIQDGAGPDGQGTIDMAYARWVFCFLGEPEGVIRGLRRMLRPGGRIAIQDYFNYERCLTLAPRREAFTKVINAVGASWRSRGGDTDVMAKLPDMLIRHGFEVAHLDVVQKIARPGSTMWHWPNSFWRTFVPKLVESGFITAEDQVAFAKVWEDASKDPSSFIQLPPVFELVAVKK